MKELKSSVQKTFAILEYFTIQKPEWGVTELAEMIGSNKSTIHRFFTDLCKLGVLYKDPAGDKYSLGLKLFELGGRVKLRTAFVDKTHPELITMSTSFKETVHIAVLKNMQVFYVDKLESDQGLSLSSRIGSYNPAYATSLGKVLLAFLPDDLQDKTVKFIMGNQKPIAFTKNTITTQKKLMTELKKVKANEYAIDREELELGLMCIAIPIFNQNEEVVAALSVSGPANRFDEKKVMTNVAILNKCASAIKKNIGLFKPF